MSTNLTPRLSSSRQWTDLPKEFTAKVKTVFDNQFKAEIQLGEFLIDGRIYPGEVILRIGYLEFGRLKQVNFEASMDIPSPSPAAGIDEEAQSSTMERLYVCIDALGSCFEEYFTLGEGDEIDIPRRWKEFDFEDATVFMQHSTVNTRLEEEADRILGLAETNLFNDGKISEDALGNAEIDSDLAFEIQKAIRSGKYPQSVDGEPSGDPN